MRKLLLSLIIGLLVFGGVPAFADATTTETTTTETSSIMDSINVAATLKNLAVNTEPSIYYSLKDHEIDYLTQYSLISKETSFGTFSFNAAYGSSDTLLGVISYKTDTLEKLGVNVMFLKDIFASIGAGAGYSEISSKDRSFDIGFIAGIGASIQWGK